uniref:Uncharacterized protein n=1 Tax=Micrurus carvalhoi TaxID=3147026 RepID=A0A2H6N0T9_9SAUR
MSRLLDEVIIFQSHFYSILISLDSPLSQGGWCLLNNEGNSIFLLDCYTRSGNYLVQTGMQGKGMRDWCFMLGLVLDQMYSWDRTQLSRPPQLVGMTMES